MLGVRKRSTDSSWLSPLPHHLVDKLSNATPRGGGEPEETLSRHQTAAQRLPSGLPDLFCGQSSGSNVNQRAKRSGHGQTLVTGHIPLVQRLGTQSAPSSPARGGARHRHVDSIGKWIRQIMSSQGGVVGDDGVGSGLQPGHVEILVG